MPTPTLLRKGQFCGYGSSLNATMGFDAYGFPASVVTGTIQNYSFCFNPVTGNLNWRQNNKYTGLKEDFQYDDLDRLSTVTKNSVTTLSMSYDGNTGGLAGKSDAGTFTYDPFERPYAIESIYPTTGLVPDSTQTTGYTSFNKVESISENGYEANFIYGSDDQRSRMIVKQNGNTILTRWYPTGSYMKETSGGVTKEYTFLGGDAYTAPVAAITQGGTTNYYYLLRDHLGSITHVVKASDNTLAYEYSFDAWGRMRNPTTWTNYEPGSEPALFIAGRGFTGHEHLPWFNTINMNGRLYDPLIGMFLSPDNYVQEPGLTQSYNRYTYCLNNPMAYTDPLGYLFERRKKHDPCNTGDPGPHADDVEEFFYNLWQALIGGGGNGYSPSSPALFEYWYLNNGISVGGRSIGGTVTYGGSGAIGSMNYGGEEPPQKVATGDGRWIILPLGDGKPYLKYQEKYTNNYHWYWGTDYQLIIRVYGKQYSDYNWVQTVTWDDDRQKLDGTSNNGFMVPTNPNSPYRIGAAANFQGDADMYFFDKPNAHKKFMAELTLVGRINNGWEVIQSFTWGFKYSNGVLTPFGLKKIITPSEYHILKLNLVL